MLFSVDTNNKIIFGWSAKCGCSHIMNIYWFLQNGNTDNVIHTSRDSNDLPNDIENYTTLIICRNPYKRIVSGFLDKYSKKGQFRELWKNQTITFSQFVDELENNKWEMIDRHHFTPQTTENFNKKILLSKIIKFYDICDIDYEYIENLYNKKIPEAVMNKKEGHERVNRIEPQKILDQPVYDLNLDDYVTSNVSIKNFYNEEIKQKVFNFYINDFNFFYENGIDYINSPI